MFPVEIVHWNEEAYVFNVAEVTAKVIRMAHSRHEGDILAFLPGEREVCRCADMLEGGLGETRVYPLYGMLPLEEQRLAVAPSAPGKRKIVLATPIAETSLTIEGVRVVVDSGLCRKQVFDTRSSMTRLETVRISLDMAEQRSGRAGRVAPGVCYRLWHLGAEKNMPAVRVPEILEADLAGTMLDIAAWGERIGDIPWIDMPKPANMSRARTLLESLGAIDGNGRITSHGRALSGLPCHPRIGQMLLKASAALDKALAADIAALLEERDPMAGIMETGIDIRVAELRKNRRKGSGGIWGRLAKEALQYCRISGVGTDDSAADPYRMANLSLRHILKESARRGKRGGAGSSSLTAVLQPWMRRTCCPRASG